jgi:hypothetical protein
MPTPIPDKHTLYSLAAQNPARDAALLLAILRDRTPHRSARGRRLRGPTLGEDFSGTAALSRAWCDLARSHAAIAVDHDPDVLARARPHPRVRLVHADVLAVKARVDLIAVQNFSICELKTRPALLAYLRHARARLTRAGLLVCDIYAGADAFATGTIRDVVDAPGLPRGTSLAYSWEQRTADPLTGRVVNAMHFALRARGTRVAHLPDAFVYDWRLWSVPELRDAMAEAGFASTFVYPRTPDALDSRGKPHVLPVDDPADLGDSFNVYIVAQR